jgi:hypothetical protein
MYFHVLPVFVLCCVGRGLEVCQVSVYRALLVVNTSSTLRIRPFVLFASKLLWKYGCYEYIELLGPLGLGMNPTVRLLPTQDKTNTEETRTDIHALNEIRTHDTRVWAGEDIICLRPLGHCDTVSTIHEIKKLILNSKRQNEPIHQSVMRRYKWETWSCRTTMNKVYKCIHSDSFKQEIWFLMTWDTITF